MVDSIKCEVCRAELFQGQEIMIKNVELLQINGLVIHELRANCAVCGAEFNYSLSAKQLKSIVERINKPIPIGIDGLPKEEIQNIDQKDK